MSLNIFFFCADETVIAEKESLFWRPKTNQTVKIVWEHFMTPIIVVSPSKSTILNKEIKKKKWFYVILRIFSPPVIFIIELIMVYGCF